MTSMQEENSVYIMHIIAAQTYNVTDNICKEVHYELQGFEEFAPKPPGMAFYKGTA